MELTMKKGIALLLAAGSLGALAVPAAAQEFTGPWIAGVADYDINEAGSSQDDGVNVDRDQNAEGLAYGVGIGYDVDMGGFVLGAEAELTDSTADSDYSEQYTNFRRRVIAASRDSYIGPRV